MIKEQNCFNYFPGDVTLISGDALSNLLSRTKVGDNQRCTNELYYIYAKDNLLGGR